MPLKVPPIDDSGYEAILRNALSRVRVHNPEWTNLNDSDPGVTLLQLFAFMADSLVYRMNQIPDRNRRKFLTLLGVPMVPASAARAIVTFQNDRGPMRPYDVLQDTELRAGQLPFRTEHSVTVLPVEGRVYYKRKLDPDEEQEQRLKYARMEGRKQAAGSEELQFYETTLLEPPKDVANMPVVDLKVDTVDRALWIALMLRPDETADPPAVRAALDGKVLSLGVVPAYAGDEVALAPARVSPTDWQNPLQFELLTGDMKDGQPIFHRLRADTRDRNLLYTPGVADITLEGKKELGDWQNLMLEGHPDLPPELGSGKEKSRVVTWIRARLQEERQSGEARITWMGINGAEALQKARVVAELAGKGTGEPDQTYSLVHTNVIPRSVEVTVGGKPWAEIDDLLAAGSEVSVRDPHRHPGMAQGENGPTDVFTVDREAGVIRFGDGARGARPPKGAEIRVTYEHGGGHQGNVGIGVINKAAALPPGFKVNNPLPAWGGDEPETIDEAEKNISRYLRHRDRLVTMEDFEDIVKRTPGVDIGRVQVLPNYNRDFPQKTPLPGSVTIMVIPRYQPTADRPPEPDRFFLDLVGRYIDLHRLITTEVRIIGPKYLPLFISIGISVLPGLDRPRVYASVNERIKQFLSPLEGGREGKGWPLGQKIFAEELRVEIEHLEGVRMVTDILMGTDEQNMKSMAPVELAPLQLPWLRQVVTQSGKPQPLAGSGGGQTKVRVVAVSEIPGEC